MVDSTCSGYTTIECPLSTIFLIGNPRSFSINFSFPSFPGKLIVKYIKARTKPDRDNIEKFETSSHYKLLDKKEIDI